MFDLIQTLAAMLFVLALIFLIFVAPVWIGVRHLAKKRSSDTLATDERTELQRLAEAEVAMRDRIAALESILDAETPHWRRTADADSASGRR